MKLTNPQMKVIGLMQQGWELGYSHGLSIRIWLQENGLGRGGATEDVRFGTFDALHTRKLIGCSKQGFPSSKYSLTDLGKTFEL